MHAAIIAFNSKVEQKCREPVVAQFIFVKRSDMLDAPPVILARCQIRAEQQQIIALDESSKLWQDRVRLEVRNHSEERKDTHGFRRDL